VILEIKFDYKIMIQIFKLAPIAIHGFLIKQ
jgi:hypothetical protein